VQEVWSKDLKYLWESDPINPGPIFFCDSMLFDLSASEGPGSDKYICLPTSNIRDPTFDIQHPPSQYLFLYFVMPDVLIYNFALLFN